MAEQVKGLREFERDLDEFLDQRTINKAFVEWHGDTVIRIVISQARLGIGPGDTRYPAYSEKYAAKKRKRGGTLGNWLRGMGHTGVAGGMLDPKNFSWRTTRNGLWLVWTAPDERTGIYAEVHNEGLPLGPGGPRKKREFMHFDTRASGRAVFEAYQDTVDRLAAKFSAEWR